MIILGIDPGTGRTGWGVIKKIKSPVEESSEISGSHFEYVAHGCVVTEQKNQMQDRLAFLYDSLNDIVFRFKPEILVVEQIFFGRNSKTAMSVGQARGVIMLCASKNKLPLFEYTSISVKHFLSGNGRTDKKDMQILVRKLLHKNKVKLSFNSKDKGFDDAADALAIAIHYVLKNK